MPRRLTEFRASSQNLRVDDVTVTINLSDYGTIQTSQTSLSAATANGDLLRRVYTDVLKYRMTASNTQIVDIVCPSGNYYFTTGSSSGDYFPLDLSNPYGMRVRIRAATIPSWGGRPTMTTGTDPNEFLNPNLTAQGRYNLLKDFFSTRFYFNRNGINGGVINPVAGRIPGIYGIGIFGRQSESPSAVIGNFDTEDTATYARGIAGSLDIGYCCVFGFGNYTFSEDLDANSGWGIGAEGGNGIFSSNIIISDCGRGLHVQRNGSFTNFGTFECVKNNEFGVLVTDNGMAYLGGEGSSVISYNGVYGVNVFAGGIVRFGEGTAAGVSHTVSNNTTGQIFIRTNGLVLYEPGDLDPIIADTAQGGAIYAKT